jgi:CHASE2 domain-containing sensor protein
MHKIKTVKENRLVKYLHDGLHHALTAAVIASCLFALESYHLLEWLDAVSIRVSQSSLNDKRLGGAEGGSPSDHTPVVFHIGDQMYEQSFFQKSPLDRGVLAQVFENISKEKPAMIVVDLDLSPGADELYSPSDGQLSLDRKLDSIAEHCQKKYSRACLVLALPIQTKWKPLRNKQYKWMKERCEAGAEFAMPTVFTHKAVAISYPKSLPNLAEVAFEELQHLNGKERLPEEHKQLEGESSSLCDSLHEYESYTEFYGHYNHLEKFHEEAVQFNTLFFHWLNRPNSLINYELMREEIPSNTKITGKTVFIGGSYGDDDRYLTTAGEMSGVFLHAAGLYSLFYPVKSTGHGWAFLLDVLVGVLLGFLFVYMWGKYNSRVNDYRENSKPNAKLTVALIRSFILMRLCLFINLTVVTLLVVVAYILASSALELRLWLNPGPLIIGMFIHGFLCSKENEERSHIDEECTKGAQTLGMLKEHPDLIWQVPLIISIIYLISKH